MAISQALEKYQGHLAVVEPQWTVEVEAEMYDRLARRFYGTG